MTPKTLFTNLRTWFRGLVWTGTSNKIFGNNVFVVPSFPAAQMGSFVSPQLFIIDQGASTYAAHPQLLDQNFSIQIWVENVASYYGESAVLSANRTANTSRGAGLLDIEEAIFPQIWQMTELSSTKIMLVEKGKVRIELTANNFPVATRTWAMHCLVTIT